MSTFPASMLMTRVGRRAGFVPGALLGVAGGLAAATGIWVGSLALLAFGTLRVGSYQAFAQFYRFAAGEVSDDAFRPSAISLVLAGGVVAALAGPMVGRFGAPLLPAEYAGSFLLLALVSLVGATVRLGLCVPASKQELGAATGYGVMILAMTATPLAMVRHHHDLSAAASVIQLHVLGMFLPSFFTGSLIARFGVLRIILTGLPLLAAHVITTLSGTGFAGALILLGVGWNFLSIGGTTLLTTTYTAIERGRAQATNDMTIFAIGLACSFSAAALLQVFGWQLLNLLLLPWLAIAAASLIWLGHRRQSEAAVLK